MAIELQSYDLRIGVTGHRDVPPYAIADISRSVEEVLRAFGRKGKRRAFLSSLAEGADLIAAEIAVRLGYDLLVPLPFEQGDYVDRFPEADRVRFEHLTAHATNVFVAPRIEPNEKGLSIRDWLYRQAGLYIANECQVLLALWDGQPSTGTMCGTADIVEYATNLSGGGDSDSPLGPREIIQIVTPRDSTGQQHLQTGEVIWLVENGQRRA